MVNSWRLPAQSLDLTHRQNGRDTGKETEVRRLFRSSVFAHFRKPFAFPKEEFHTGPPAKKIKVEGGQSQSKNEDVGTKRIKIEGERNQSKKEKTDVE